MTKREFVEQFILNCVVNGNFSDDPRLLGHAETQWNRIEEMDRKDRGDHYA